MRRVIAAATAVLALAGCAAARSSGPVEYEARSFADEEVQVSLEELRGRPALLFSWATWCAPCKEELPELERLWRQRRGEGLLVVAVNINASGVDGAARRMARSLGLTMPLWSDRANRFTAVFDGVGVPMTVLVDRDGRALAVWHGATDFDDKDVKDAIESALDS